MGLVDSAVEDYLAGLTPAGVVSLVAWRRLGPLDPRRPRAVVRWATTAWSPRQVAAAVGASAQSVRDWVRHVQDASTAVAVPEALAAGLATAIGDRVAVAGRQARILGVPGPPSPAAARRPSLSQADHGLVRVAGRVLAAVGPLGEADLVEAVLRRARHRGGTITSDDVRRALRGTDTLLADDDGHWRLTRPRDPEPRDTRLLELATGPGTLTSRQVRDVLTLAGYTASSARGPALHRHPMLLPVGRGRWRVLRGVTA